jgi:hypothetical protein
MLLTNETLPLLPVQFFSTDEKPMRCLVSMRSRLQTHFFVLLLIHMFFVHIYIILLHFSVGLIIFSPRFRNFILIIKSSVRLRSYAPEGRYLYAIVLLIKEVVFIFVYILFAFLYKWFRLTNNDYRITSMNVRRWLVESSFAPFLFLGFLIEYCIGRPNIIFDEY